MANRAPIETRNLDRYGNAELPWSRPREVLEATGEALDTWFLNTVGPDGRPHTAGVGALWLDGQLFFTSGPGTRKSRHLAENPAASIAVSLEGVDLVFEGLVARVTDRPTLEAAAARYDADGWPAEVDEANAAITAPFSAPSAGPPPWYLYRLDFERVYGVASAEPHGATRWTFARD